MTANASIAQAQVHGIAGKDADGNPQWVLVGTDGSVSISPLAGERNAGTANDYFLTRTGNNLTIIGVTTAVTIGAGAANDTRLYGINITAALTGTCVIAGFADSAAVATNITIPAASVGFKEFGNAINSAGALTVTCSNAADDNLVQVIWSAV